MVGDDVSRQCRIAEVAASLAAKSEVFLRRRECVFQARPAGVPQWVGGGAQLRPDRDGLWTREGAWKQRARVWWSFGGVAERLHGGLS